MKSVMRNGIWYVIAVDGNGMELLERTLFRLSLNMLIVLVSLLNIRIILNLVG